MTLDDFSPEFRRYLEYMGKMPGENATPEMLNSIYSDNHGKFETWDKLPEALKNRYKGSVPQDVLDAAARDEFLVLREMEYHPEIKYANDARERVEEQYLAPNDISGDLAKAAFVGAMIAGYSKEASADLARHAQIRENLSDKARNGTLSEEEKKAWAESRQADIKTIQKDWTENSPEKLLIHVLSDYNRGKLSKEEVTPMIADLMQKIDNEGRHEQLMEYMKQVPIKAKLSHFKDDVLNLLETAAIPKVQEAPQQQQSLRTLAENIRTEQQNRQNRAPRSSITMRQQFSSMER